MKTILLPAAFAAFAALSQTSHAQTPPRPSIVVSGEGEAAVAPDMAVVSLAVLREAGTARAALDASNEAVASVIAAMKEAGVAARDLQTSGLQINPLYVYPQPGEANQQPRITGYSVANSLTVRVRDLTKLGAILDRSVTLGVNQGGSIQFANDDPAATLTEARKRAVKDAVQRATTLAEAASVGLGPILEISEQTFAAPPMPYMAKTMARDEAAAAVPVEAGENSYRVQVTVTFALESR